jgi:hypothetical protein
MNDILDRLDRLERRNDALAAQNRLLRVLLAAAVVAGGVALLGGRADAQPDKAAVVKATAFIVVDEKGQERARLAMDADGVGLTMLDGKGKEAAAVQVARGRPAIVLRADEGDSEAVLGVLSAGPQLRLKYEKQQTVLVSSSKVGTRLELIHEAGRPAMQLMTTRAAAALGWIQKKDARGVIVLEDRATVPSFQDGDGKPLLPRLLPKK